MVRSRIAPLTLGLALAAMVASSSPLAAQPAAPPSDTVVVRAKSPLAAGLLEWIVPTAGYAYAGNWKRGLLPAAAKVGGLALFFSSWESDFILSREREACGGTCTAGLLVATAGVVWSLIDAPAEARRYNERNGIAASIRVTPDFGPNGAGLGVRIPLGT